MLTTAVVRQLAYEAKGGAGGVDEFHRYLSKKHKELHFALTGRFDIDRPTTALGKVSQSRSKS